MLKIILPLLATHLGHASATGSTNAWKPAGPGDLRGPCPMLNTLANHGFIPHNGRNITREVVLDAVSAAIGFGAELGNLMFDRALIVNPEANATYFDLGQLGSHNILEHDASLSRTDATFGDHLAFNQTVFDATKSFWTDEVVTIEMLSNSKLYQQIQSRAFNANYTFTSTAEAFSVGEVASPIFAFGDMEQGTTNRTLVTYFFENERLPTELGWSKLRDNITLAAAQVLIGRVSNASNLLTDSPAAAADQRRSVHGWAHFS